MKLVNVVAVVLAVCLFVILPLVGLAQTPTPEPTVTPVPTMSVQDSLDAAGTVAASGVFVGYFVAAAAILLSVGIIRFFKSV
ncbi:MAG TPA: hypothetical protein V6C97_27185 [Oculatellaceae cyanobacterium]